MPYPGLYMVAYLLASFLPVFFSLAILKIRRTALFTEVAGHERLYPWALVVNDARLYAYLLALYLPVTVSRNLAVTLILKTLIALIVLAMVVDAGVSIIFSARFDLTEAYKLMFKRDTRYSLEVMRLLTRRRDAWRYLVVCALAIASILAFWVTETPRRQEVAWGIVSVAVVFYFISAVFNTAWKTNYLWGVQNVIDFNLTLRKRSKPYSRAFARHLLATYHEPQHACLTGLGTMPRPNLILIVMESLSMHHSRYLSGRHDFTPHLDALMQQNLVFTNFYANGLTSEEGLIALLLGQFPLASPRCRFLPDFTVFSQPQDSVPKFLQRHQYQTVFLTSADFDSFGVGAWAHNIGFQTVRSRENMRFDHSRALGFTTALDDVLYLNALMTIQTLSSPYFLALETGLTHEPFVDPETLDVSEERCFKYADRKLFDFIQALEAQHFFDKGLVMIVSDHRQRGVVRPEEAKLYGNAAFFRIPCVIIDGQHTPRRVADAYQQSDLFPSLKYLIGSGDLRLNPMQGVFLPAPQIAPQYILAKHSGGFAGTVTVAHHNRCDRIILEGERTRCEDRQAKLQDVIDYLNYTRLTATGPPAATRNRAT